MTLLHFTKRCQIGSINEHLGEDLSIGAIAEELEMSQYHFSRLFKQSTGSSPYQYIVQQRIEQAKYLLRATPLSVAAIAHMSKTRQPNPIKKTKISILLSGKFVPPNLR